MPRATLAAEALNIMEQRKITSIVVAEDGEPRRVAGVLHLHDLWRMEIVLVTSSRVTLSRAELRASS